MTALRAARRHRHRRVLAGTGALLLLAGCGQSVDGTATAAPTSGPGPGSSSSSAPGPSAGATEETSGLTPGLLPADAFPPGSTVTAISDADLASAVDPTATEGVTITPEQCAAAVSDTQVSAADYDDLVAQTAVTGPSSTVELLSLGGPVEETVTALRDAPTQCPAATVTSPEIGEATITYVAVPVPELGDGSAAVLYTTSVAQPDGTAVAVPTLIGVARDGDRLVTLLTITAAGTADQAAFADLLARAFQHQADALD